MRTLILLIAVLTLSSTSVLTMASKTNDYSDIEIIFVSKAYWDGPSKSCLDRERGCCIHISFKVSILDNQIAGDLTKDGEFGLKLTFSKTRGAKPGTLKEFLSTGKFYMDGEGTLSEEVLKSLMLPQNFKIAPGYYDYIERGDMITVLFR